VIQTKNSIEKIKLKKRSLLNKTISLSKKEIARYSENLIKLNEDVDYKSILNKTINQNLFEVLKFLPPKFVDLLVIDPPYNLSKNFNSTTFKEKSILDYAAWLESFIVELKRTLKPTASVYFCGDWHTSLSIPLVLEKHFIIRNRITWEREKGRGASKNWKNNSEDIWFCTMSNKYFFNTDAVMLTRKVLAPYRELNREPKDWKENSNGCFRTTFPSNIWNDISIPFWSMPENTEHPTQKPEKLIAKLILASSKKGQVVLDPFLGSGTTSVVSKKLGRKYIGIEIDKYYACLAEKRLEMAGTNLQIQGYDYGIFWERNTKPFPLITNL
jgi:site-specific DNA-methyltransferase (adenine-specific)